MSAISSVPSQITYEHRMLAMVRFVGMFLFGCGAFLVASLLSADVSLDPVMAARSCWTGLLGAWASFYIRHSVGTVPAFAISGFIMFWGISVAKHGVFWRTWPKVAGGMLAVCALSVLFECIALTGGNPLVGGLIGRQITPAGVIYLGRAGLFGMSLLALAIGSMVAFGTTVATVGHKIQHICHRLAESCRRVAATIIAYGSAYMAAHRERARERDEKHRAEQEAAASVIKPAPTHDAPIASFEEMAAPVVPKPFVDEALQKALEAACDDEAEEPSESVSDDEVSAAIVAPLPPKVVSSATSAKSPPRSVKKNRVMTAGIGDYVLPSIELLEKPEETGGENRTTLEKRSAVLEETLAHFKIDGRVVGIECGPRVTMFEVALAPGIRVSKIFSLADNITMALKAYNVRIVAPIPGKDTVGIEIPNMENQLVALRNLFEDFDFKTNTMAAPMILGADIRGRSIITDLAKAPHMLIAGATGSGKSVCINTILVSFLMTKRPDELKLILIDPKMVELSRFRDVPHLMSPVVTDMKRAAAILEWACTEMDRRYSAMATLQLNNISKFNKMGAEAIEKRLRAEEMPEDDIELFPKKMPYIVIVIDELADLMMVVGKEVEASIIRLAAKSRAVGIHVILATQRPSVDVITGLIKANMPSRIAFQVASKVDSRTILDANGAETLLGAGDMLYLPPGTSKIIRSQGVYVSDEELFAVVDHCKEQMQPEYHAELEGPVIVTGANVPDGERDELFDAACRAVIESGRGSVSLIQRKLGVGYGRGSRIVDQMAAAGVLGPFRGEGKPRDIIMTMEQYEARFHGAGTGYDGDDEDDLGDGCLAGLHDDERERPDMEWDDAVDSSPF